MPWDGAWRITQLMGGRVRFVLASSGHIAGMINPPGGKGTYWVNGGRRQVRRRLGARRQSASRKLVDRLVPLARRHAGEKVAPPSMGNVAHPPLLDAPGSYVLEK